MGSMPNPIGGSGGDPTRGQYHVHQQHQYHHQQPPQHEQQQSQFHHQQQQHHHHQHHHHHQLLQGQGQAGHGHVHRHGHHVHSHSSRHPHGDPHERSASGSSRDERRESSSHHPHQQHGVNLPPGFAMATGGETPYGMLQPQQHGGFVMGTDLRTTTTTTTPTSGGWYHKQPEVPQVQTVMTSLESVPEREESTVPKDSGMKVNADCKLVFVSYTVDRDIFAGKIFCL